MKKILFVDDEPNVLEGLQRMLRPLRHEWEMTFVSSGYEAIQILDRERFHVIVSDMRMPGMNGAQLLSEVMKTQPQVVRIILSGQSDQEAVLRSVGPAHQFLSKPCDADLLKTTIARACTLRDLLANGPLQKLISRMETLPSLPALYAQVLEAVQAPDASVRAVGEIIACDVGMTAKILQLVNSAFFGLPRRVSDPTQAVSLIGLDTVQSLVLSVHVFSQWDQQKLPSVFLEALWRHSLTVGKFAKKIASTQYRDRRLLDDAFTAGLLHDAGKLALVANLGPAYRETLAMAVKEQIPLAEAEREMLGATHAEVGAYLLGLWGLPDSIVEALAYHHSPAYSRREEFSALTAVHVANCLEHEARLENRASPASVVDQTYLTRLGLEDQMPVWRQLCRRAQVEDER